MVDHFFVLPENKHLPSGGNHYNFFLIRALKKKGANLSTGNFNQVLQAVKKNTRMCVWVDSLYLDRFPFLLESTTSRQKVFLIAHHLPSFEPDLSQTESKERTVQEQKSFSGAAGFLVTNHYVKKLLMTKGFKNAQFVVVPPALCINPLKKEASSKGFRGIMVANLISRKGVLDFLKCLEKEIGPEDDFIINIAGRHDIEPSYADACSEYISHSPLLNKSIRFLGPISIKKMNALYASSSILISSSKMETYGMAVEEALAFSLPVIAYDGGYVRFHIKNGVNGFLCSSFPELARTCVKFIRNPRRMKSLQDKTEKLRTQKKHTWDEAAEMFLRQTSLSHNLNYSRVKVASNARHKA